MSRTSTERQRLTGLIVIMSLIFVLFVGRLVQLQVVERERCSRMMADQSTGQVPIPADRGAIFDRSGRIVAKSVSGYALCAEPRTEADVQLVGQFLDSLHGLPAGSSIQEHKIAKRKFRYIKRNISDELAHDIEQLEPAGIVLRREPRRQYPFGTAGKQIVGFTDIDNKGASGLELAFDSLLTGTAGQADILRDGLDRSYRFEETALIPPTPGASVVLTIDWQLQEILESSLKHVVDSFGIQTGMGIFLDVETGEILAMAHYDTTDTDPNRPTKLRVIADQFEPGSSAKAFTAAAALDAGVVRLDEWINLEHGAWRINGRVLNDPHPKDGMTFLEVMEKSSNIGAGKVGVRVGGERLYQFYKDMGFGEKVRLGIPGEVRGNVVQPNRWNDFTIATLSIGHAVAVNALQLATAYAALANGGELLKPQLVYGYVNEDGSVRRTAERKVVRRVFSEKITPQLHQVLRSIVEHGTAVRAKSDYLAIAGKTGTPQLVDPVTKRYSHSMYLGCFAGFFPLERPKIAGVVVLKVFDREREAGATAAPLFRAIADRFYVTNPDLFTVPLQTRTLLARSENRQTIPSLIGMPYREAKAETIRRGVELVSTADEGTVSWQFPPPGEFLTKGQRVLILASHSSQRVMPNLRLLTVREAAALLASLGVEVMVFGRGEVAQQSIPIGTTITDGMICRLDCSVTPSPIVVPLPVVTQVNSSSDSAQAGAW